MKKIIFLNLFLALSIASFGQPNNKKVELNKDYYLKKRSQNNTAAHLMLWSGLTAAIVGGIIDNYVNFDGPRGWFGSRSRGTSPYKHGGAAIAYSGLVLVTGSIPFFYFAVKNKQTATSLSFKNETAPQLQGNGFANKTVPSLSLKISL